MKLLQAHLNLFKLLFYCLLLAISFIAFGTIFSFYSHNIVSLNNIILQTSQKNIILQTPQKPFSLADISPLLTPPSPPQSLPRRLNVAKVINLSNPENEIVWKNDTRESSETEGVVVKSDKELMKRASMTSSMRIKEEVPKVAFLFLVKRSVPLAPLWEEFFKGHQGFYSIYVHVDPSFNSSLDSETGVFHGRRIASKEVQWGNFSMIEAELRLISNALRETSNQRFVLLSESCIPLFNFHTIYTYLMNSTDSYIEAYDKLGPKGRGRYKYSLYPSIKARHWRKGSQWFEMHRDLAIKALSDWGYFSAFKRACKSACCADEHYLPTWVNMHYRAKNSNRSLTWVDWSNGGSHPASYRRMHVTVEFLKWLRSGETCRYNGERTKICYLFARKFIPDCLDRLLRFAPKLMNF